MGEWFVYWFPDFATFSSNSHISPLVFNINCFSVRKQGNYDILCGFPDVSEVIPEGFVQQLNWKFQNLAFMKENNN